MLNRAAAVIFVSMIWLALVNVSVFACACCAEPGTYILSSHRPREYEIGLLKEMAFDRKANLYLTEAGFETVKGLDDLSKESEMEAYVESYDELDLVNSFTGRVWRFELRSAGGKKGTLVLPLPAAMVNFKVDIHDVENRPNGPLLYKELRFKGNISSATGIFRSGSIRPATYFLVFQGRGNGCDEVSNYTDWRLEINGPHAHYAFYGKLSSGEKIE